MGAKRDREGARLWIGLLSGTSADAVDAALVRLGPGLGDVALLLHRSYPIEDALRAQIHELDGRPLRELLALDTALGERFAGAALALAGEAGVPLDEIEGIGSHGQTVAHHPEPPVRSTLQIASPAVLHERTGLPVVADFRRADLAAGGQGAPLTPFLHQALFASRTESRAVLNIGGFTNLTWLPQGDAGAVIAFDPGPGNAWLDRTARRLSAGHERFDRDGRRARRGQVVEGVLEELLADPYFAKPPPKSTGHEHFGAQELEQACAAVRAAGGSDDDLLATLAELTIQGVARSAAHFLPRVPARWILCGGGVHNPVLREGLARALAPARVETSDAHGLPVDAVESVAFAHLGWCARRGIPSNLPAATGARRRVVLGAMFPAG